MPITGPSSYLPTTDAFVTHWEEVDAALGVAHPLVLADGTTRSDLVDRRGDLRDAHDAVTDAGIERALARAGLDALLDTLQRRLVEFNEKVRADLPGSIYTRALPAAFHVGDAEGTVRDGLRQMRLLWAKINALSVAPPGLALPMTLLDGYTADLLIGDIGALRELFLALSDAGQSLKLAREQRNDVQDVIYPILKNYRLKVPTKFAPGNALVESLPRLTPEPGRTPAAVVAYAVWDAPSEKAKITWAASSDGDLEKYEVRAVPGDSYNSDDETVLATVLPGAAREFSTDFALSAAGLTAGFKVYVMLNTGNEKGSEPVYVTRPG